MSAASSSAAGMHTSACEAPGSVAIKQAAISPAKRERPRALELAREAFTYKISGKLGTGRRATLFELPMGEFALSAPPRTIPIRPDLLFTCTTTYIKHTAKRGELVINMRLQHKRYRVI